MVQEAIAHGCFVDVARFGVVDFEMLIRAVYVRARYEIMMQFEDMIHEMQLKLEHILLCALASDKFSPGFQ